MIAVVKGVVEGIGLRGMLGDWREKVKVVVCCDSGAAVSIVNRRGVGRVRHLDVGMMWIQEMREEGEVMVQKISGKGNVADQLTKYLGNKEVERGLQMLGMEVRTGRPEGAVKLAEGWGVEMVDEGDEDEEKE